MPTTTVLTHRLARKADIEALRALMTLSIQRLIGAYLDPARVTASFEIMGVDPQLIDDGTYFVVESGGRIVGCGGWSRRPAMFSHHQSGPNTRLLDPATEPARVRAVYTHPDFVRQGIGKRILELSEIAAAREGYRSLELVGTVAGEPLFTAFGFTVVERVDVPTSKGITVPCARMRKEVSAASGH
jgi:GNAT superfamily N-acetyltransferase